jgi:ribosome-associated protein
MDRQLLRAWLEEDAETRFSRSSGPGGQNVNKLNTKAALFAPLALAPGLSEEERALAMERLSGRLADGGVLIVQVQDSRSQARNRELAVERALAIIEGALRRQKPRKPTKPSRAARERRMLTKHLVKEKKSRRSSAGLQWGED